MAWAAARLKQRGEHRRLPSCTCSSGATSIPRLRYRTGPLPGGEPEPIDGGRPRVHLFDFGDDILSLDMQYEDMDGMCTPPTFPPTRSILGYLRVRGSAASLSRHPWVHNCGPPRSSRSTASSKAIAALLKTCD